MAVTVNCKAINFRTVKEPCQADMRSKKIMPHYPDVELNPENDAYRKKHLGVKKRNYKK